jgi:hypothetical protein
MALKILSAVTAAAKGAAGPAGGDRAAAVVRDQLTEGVFPLEERLLRWLGGEKAASLSEPVCPEGPDVGEKRGGSPFSLSLRERILELLRCCVRARAAEPGFPEGPLESLKQLERSVGSLLAGELIPAEASALEELISGPLFAAN